MLIHMGTNDLGETSLLQLKKALHDAVDAAKRLFPGCKLVWSEVLPRVNYATALSQPRVDEARKRLNRQARGVMGRCGGHVISHPDFSSEKRDLYRGDGVHLSDTGNKLLVDSFREGLTLFSLYPTIFRYPLL